MKFNYSWNTSMILQK